MLCNTSLTTGR